MIDERRAQRNEALRLYNRMTRTSRFRRHQQKLWGDAVEITVVPALESDRVVDVEQRVDNAGGTADVVVYWPDEGRIVVAYSSRPTIDHRDDSIFSIDPVQVHPDSTMAMLLALIEASGRVFTTSRADVLAHA
ncbi:hypothetical protein MML61_10225 [Mycobacterium marinum]|uniref:hypothetical protein n=1 Tax=Mycobacterium marinum TaxID=1781 RepID=UPI002359F38B|nr:hypothetical protein [Mycobacterium marinum]WCS20148.1 hypothetical protein MML61_10225 [Mycobacterium marinum]